MSWFPREYLVLLGPAMWGIAMLSMIKFVGFMADRQERREARRAATAAPESRPKSSE